MYTLRIFEKKEFHCSPAKFFMTPIIGWIPTDFVNSGQTPIVWHFLDSHKPYHFFRLSLTKKKKKMSDQLCIDNQPSGSTQVFKIKARLNIQTVSRLKVNWNFGSNDYFDRTWLLLTKRSAINHPHHLQLGYEYYWFWIYKTFMLSLSEYPSASSQARWQLALGVLGRHFRLLQQTWRVFKQRWQHCHRKLDHEVFEKR